MSDSPFRLNPMIDASRVTLEKLLDEGHEHERLDFKDRFDAADPAAWVEIAKDVGAMQIDGGHIVLGASEEGIPTGLLTEEQAKRLDETKVRAKLKKWLAEPLVIRAAAYEVSGKWVGLICVEPSVDGFGIFKIDGGNAPNQVFRAGEVFARHGSASERWQQSDIERIKQNLRQRSDEASRRAVLAIALPRATQMAGQMEGLLRDLAQAASISLDPSQVSKDQIRQICLAVSPNSAGKSVAWNPSGAGGFRPVSILQVMWTWRMRSRDAYNDLIPFFPLMDVRLTVLLTHVEKCSFFSFLEALISTSAPIKSQSIDFFADEIFKYVGFVGELRTHLTLLGMVPPP